MTDRQRPSVQDRSDIIDVVTRYAVGIDLKDWDRFGSCFADSVELRLVSVPEPVVYTRAQLVEYARRTFTQYSATQHISANHQVVLDDAAEGEAATCLSTLNATHYVADDPGGPLQRQLGYYRYTLVKSDQWLISGVEQLLFWQDGNQEIFDRAHIHVTPSQAAGGER